jgi:hypothetical protein
VVHKQPPAQGEPEGATAVASSGSGAGEMRKRRFGWKQKHTGWGVGVVGDEAAPTAARALTPTGASALRTKKRL